MTYFTELYHRFFHIPYKLHVASDSKEGLPVIFLHGVASDSNTWKYVLPLMPPGYRSIAIDLLGFGNSPKPKHNAYDTVAHALAIINTIKKLHLQQPAILVGHSMGGLLAIELAKRHPDQFSSIILVSTPLYNPEDIITATSKYASSKRSLSNGLFIAYERVITNEKITLKAAQAMMKLTLSSNSFILTKETWSPFKLSLTNTIMRQHALADIAQLKHPIKIIYGKLDLLIQHKNYEALAAAHPENISVSSYTGAHMITKNGAELVVMKIEESTKL